MKTNAKKISLVVICVLVGYVLGSVVGLPGTSGALGTGDISKVSKYQKNLVSPQANAFQEKILADSTARAKAAASLILLTSRMQEFSDLVDYAAKVSDGKSELADVVAKLQTVKRISDNATKAGAEAKEAFVDVVNQEAKNSAAVYETASKNLTLAYLMLDRQMKLGNEYVLAVDSYLAGKNIEDNKELAMARELWVSYLYGNARLNKDSEQVAYFKEKGSLLNENEFKAAFNVVDSALRQSVLFDAYCGISELLNGNNELLNGNNELLNGNNELLNGNNELLNGNNELLNGNNELLNGNNELLNGNNELLNGNNEVWKSISELLNGNNEVWGSISELLNGNNELLNGNNEVVVEEIK